MIKLKQDKSLKHFRGNIINAKVDNVKNVVVLINKKGLVKQFKIEK